IGYWAYQLASEVQNGIYIDSKSKITIAKPAKSNKVYYYFTNIGNAYTAAITTGNVQIQKAEIHFVKGDYAYSAAGFAGYMGKGSTPSYEVKGITTKTFDGTIPANAFGYIEYTLK
ncbi:MAG: hypothetical protein ACK4IY_09190, partial [Chitinophagales bacterium]